MGRIVFPPDGPQRHTPGPRSHWLSRRPGPCCVVACPSATVRLRQPAAAELPWPGDRLADAMWVQWGPGRHVGQPEIRWLEVEK